VRGKGTKLNHNTKFWSGTTWVSKT